MRREWTKLGCLELRRRDGPLQFRTCLHLCAADWLRVATGQSAAGARVAEGRLDNCCHSLQLFFVAEWLTGVAVCVFAQAATNSGVATYGSIWSNCSPTLSRSPCVIRANTIFGGIKLCKKHNTDTAPQAAKCICSGAVCHRQSRCTAYRPQSKLAPTDSDLQQNSHAHSWSAV